MYVYVKLVCIIKNCM